eukprot:COSAG01_NODE_3729_length_5755_cov_7.355135_8_plen_177_part_00
MCWQSSLRADLGASASQSQQRAERGNRSPGGGGGGGGGHSSPPPAAAGGMTIGDLQAMQARRSARARTPLRGGRGGGGGALPSFDTLDADGDGVITREEYLTHAAAARTPTAAPAVAPPPQSTRAGSPADRSGATLPPDGPRPPATLARADLGIDHLASVGHAGEVGLARRGCGCR